MDETAVDCRTLEPPPANGIAVCRAYTCCNLAGRAGHLLQSCPVAHPWPFKASRIQTAAKAPPRCGRPPRRPRLAIARRPLIDLGSIGSGTEAFREQSAKSAPPTWRTPRVSSGPQDSWTAGQLASCCARHLTHNAVWGINRGACLHSHTFPFSSSPPSLPLQSWLARQSLCASCCCWRPRPAQVCGDSPARPAACSAPCPAPATPRNSRLGAREGAGRPSSFNARWEQPRVNASLARLPQPLPVCAPLSPCHPSVAPWPPPQSLPGACCKASARRPRMTPGPRATAALPTPPPTPPRWPRTAATAPR